MPYFDQLIKATTKNVPRETIEKLTEFAALLLKWNQKINLISKHVNEGLLWQRHILDSAQLIKYIPPETQRIVDFGSGAGFPGIILTIIGGYKVDLVESDNRKCAFMREAVAKLNLGASIVESRIEDANLPKCDLITSRALAPLVKLLDYSSLFIEKDNYMLFLKGQDVVEEIKEASTCWDFTHEISPDAFVESACVLKISNLKRKSCN